MGALPSGGLFGHFGAICAILALFALGRQMGGHHSFSLIRKSKRFYITYQKMKEIGPIPRKLWPFESMSGHRITCVRVSEVAMF